MSVCGKAGVDNGRHDRHRAGHRVPVHGRGREGGHHRADPERLDGARHALGPEVLAIRANAGVVSDAQALMREVGEAFGRIDVLFLNAGVARFAPWPR